MAASQPRLTYSRGELFQIRERLASELQLQKSPAREGVKCTDVLRGEASPSNVGGSPAATITVKKKSRVTIQEGPETETAAPATPPHVTKKQAWAPSNQQQRGIMAASGAIPSPSSAVTAQERHQVALAKEHFGGASSPSTNASNLPLRLDFGMWVPPHAATPLAAGQMQHHHHHHGDQERYGRAPTDQTSTASTTSDERQRAFPRGNKSEKSRGSSSWGGGDFGPQRRPTPPRARWASEIASTRSNQSEQAVQCPRAMGTPRGQGTHQQQDGTPQQVALAAIQTPNSTPDKNQPHDQMMGEDGAATTALPASRGTTKIFGAANCPATSPKVVPKAGTTPEANYWRRRMAEMNQPATTAKADQTPLKFDIHQDTVPSSALVSDAPASAEKRKRRRGGRGKRKSGNKDAAAQDEDDEDEEKDSSSLQQHQQPAEPDVQRNASTKETVPQPSERRRVDPAMVVVSDKAVPRVSARPLPPNFQTPPKSQPLQTNLNPNAAPFGALPTPNFADSFPPQQSNAVPLLPFVTPLGAGATQNQGPRYPNKMQHTAARKAQQSPMQPKAEYDLREDRSLLIDKLKATIGYQTWMVMKQNQGKENCAAATTEAAESKQHKAKAKHVVVELEDPDPSSTCSRKEWNATVGKWRDVIYRYEGLFGHLLTSEEQSFVRERVPSDARAVFAKPWSPPQ